MRDRIGRFVNEIPRKGHILQLVKKLDLILKLEADHNTYYLSFQNGKVDWNDGTIPAGNIVTISGRNACLEQLLDGDLKLMQGVKMNYLTTNCHFRDQLVLESLFYLARPVPA